jgi:hypothetical protein
VRLTYVATVAAMMVYTQSLLGTGDFRRFSDDERRLRLGTLREAKVSR